MVILDLVLWVVWLFRDLLVFILVLVYSVDVAVCYVVCLVFFI